jgi:hypothetical protein
MRVPNTGEVHRVRRGNLKRAIPVLFARPLSFLSKEYKPDKYIICGGQLKMKMWNPLFKKLQNINSRTLSQA